MPFYWPIWIGRKRTGSCRFFVFFRWFMRKILQAAPKERYHLLFCGAINRRFLTERGFECLGWRYFKNALFGAVCLLLFTTIPACAPDGTASYPRSLVRPHTGSFIFVFVISTKLGPLTGSICKVSGTVLTHDR